MTEQKRKTGFILHDHLYEQISLLNTEQKGILLDAMFTYRILGEEPEDLDPLTRVIFISCRQVMDYDQKAYEERCEVNRKNGQKGGRPRKSMQKTERFSEQTEKPYMDIDMDTEDEYENKIEDDMDMNGDMDREGDREENPAVSVSPSPSAPPKIKRFLKNQGLPTAYVDQRWSRACASAQYQNRTPEEVLTEWWEMDKKSFKKEPRPPSVPMSSVEKSYDTDEFFEAAVRRGLKEIDFGSK